MTTTALSAAMPAAPAWPHALPPGALGGGHPRWAVVAIVALHAVAGWALWHSKAVQHVVADAAPLFVQIISTTATPAALPTPPSPPVATPPPPTVLAPPPVVVAPSAAAAPLAVVAEAAPAPAEAPAPAPPVAAPAPSIATPIAAAAPAPAPAPAAGPRTLPPSAVQYLVPPQLDYPRASRRLRETGRATVRVLIDEAGLPAQVELARSTGYPLLDQAALAAVRAARFKPYTENGRPQAGWALIPLSFDLDS